MAGLNHQACRVLDLASAAGYQALLSKHPNENEKPEQVGGYPRPTRANKGRPDFCQCAATQCGSLKKITQPSKFRNMLSIADHFSLLLVSHAGLTLPRGAQGLLRSFLG